MRGRLTAALRAHKATGPIAVAASAADRWMAMAGLSGTGVSEAVVGQCAAGTGGPPAICDEVRFARRETPKRRAKRGSWRDSKRDSKRANGAPEAALTTPMAGAALLR